MKRLPYGALLLAAALGLTACGENTISSCNVGPGPAFNVITRDQNGTGQALGARVIFHDDSTSNADSAYRTDDTLSDYGGVQDRRYDIQVSKRYYTDGWARDAITHSNNCGLGLSKIPVVITLLPNSPPIRQMHVLPEGALLDLGADVTVASFTPFIDADEGVSHAVRWSISGDLGQSTFDSVTGHLRYSCQPVTTHATITATLLADPTFSSSSTITIQGRPTSTSDPNCR